MIELIKSIIEKRKTAGIYPHHCPINELVSESGLSMPEIREQLLPLLKDKKIRIGQTMNSHYIVLL